MDGSLITELRTGAITGLAAARLAPESSSTLAVIGTGRHARSQALALVFALPGITRISFYSRNETARTTLAKDVGLELAETYPDRRIEVRAASTAAGACEGADVVVTATNASQPVIQDAWVADAALVCGMGSHSREQSEIDPITVARADRIVVDTIAGAVDTAGDIANAIDSYGVNRGDVMELGTLLGDDAVTGNDGRLAVFKSVGFSAADVAVASFVAERALALQLGTIINIHR
ncbi:MAG: ornithine cyclodeaminase family protein [Rhodoglobus sp.]